MRQKGMRSVGKIGSVADVTIAIRAEISQNTWKNILARAGATKISPRETVTAGIESHFARKRPETSVTARELKQACRELMGSELGALAVMDRIRDNRKKQAEAKKRNRI